MLRLLETLLYRAQCRSIIVGRIINVVNHGRGPAFVWQTRNYFCHRYTTTDTSTVHRHGLFVTTETASREGERTSCRYQSAIIAARSRPPTKCVWTTDAYVRGLQSTAVHGSVDGWRIMLNIRNDCLVQIKHGIKAT